MRPFLYNKLLQGTEISKMVYSDDIAKPTTIWRNKNVVDGLLVNLNLNNKVESVVNNSNAEIINLGTTQHNFLFSPYLNRHVYILDYTDISIRYLPTWKYMGGMFSRQLTTTFNIDVNITRNVITRIIEQSITYSNDGLFVTIDVERKNNKTYIYVVSKFKNRRASVDYFRVYKQTTVADIAEGWFNLSVIVNHNFSESGELTSTLRTIINGDISTISTNDYTNNLNGDTSFVIMLQYVYTKVGEFNFDNTVIPDGLCKNFKMYNKLLTNDELKQLAE